MARLRETVVANGIATPTTFVARNLFEITPQELAGYGHADKWLVDPPREGAFAAGQGHGRLASGPITGA